MKKTINALDLFVCTFDVKIGNALLELIYSADEALTKAECFVLLDLAQRGANNGGKLIYIAQLINNCGISRSSVKRALCSLQKRGVIEYEHKQGEHEAALITLTVKSKYFAIIPREAFRACMEHIRSGQMNAAAVRVLAYVWRQTLGYKGKRMNDMKPVNERPLSDSYVMNDLGMTQKRHLYKALSDLTEYGAITIKSVKAYRNGKAYSNIRKVIANSLWIEKAAVPELSREAVPEMSHEQITVENCESDRACKGSSGERQQVTGFKMGTEKVERERIKNCLQNKDAATAAPSLDNTHAHICSEETERHTKSGEKTIEQLRAEARELIAAMKAEPPKPSKENTPAADHAPVTAVELLNAMSDEERAELHRAPSYLLFTADTPSATPAEIYDFEELKRYAAIHGTLDGFTARRATPSEPGVIADCI